jgi:2-polyprenyl-6-methoxyphenol hydroxylase-like FAD-dependent oxidoreductase
MEFLDPRHLLPLIIIGGSFTVAASVLYGAWLLGRYRGREDQSPAALADVEARLRHLEEVVTKATDALDRLEAAHRLTARLLTDRVSEKPGAGHRATTPH